MVSGTTVIADFLEPFVLGISCIVGGEQFSILLSHTNVSIKFQSFILVVTSMVTIVASAFVDAKYSLFNGYHCYYAILTVFLHVLVNERFKSPLFITLITLFIGFVVTFLVIQSLSHYFTSRMQLLAFIYGIFISRSLPYMCWYFVNKKIPYESQLHSVATSLGSIRVIFCLFSMCIKIFLGRFQFKPSSEARITLRISDLNLRIDEFLNYKNFLWIPSVYYFSERENWSMFKFPFLLYCFFMISVLIYSAFPSLIHSIYFVYSINMISLLTMIRAISHLFGSCFGISFPINISGNLSFLVITAFSYLIVILTLFFYYKFYNLSVLFFFELLTGFCLGYLWTYTLGIIISSSLNRNCKYQDYRDDCCCGDKINNECYCRLPFIIQQLKTESSKNKLNFLQISTQHDHSPTKGLFPCSKVDNTDNKPLRYDKESKNAVLIYVGKHASSYLKQITNTTCKDAHTECLRLLNIFILDSVTVSSCTQCQLTIRLESRLNTESLQCKSCSEGIQCTCSTDIGKCCCHEFKCCSETCNKSSCKIHFCCCNKTCNSCKDHIESKPRDTARLFMCFENTVNKCALKEVKPNSPSDFDGDFSKLNEFDISCMFFSNCCHVDLQVDLYCSMKNNFFRLTGINFQNKYSVPKSLILKSTSSQCVHKKEPQCCCAYRDLVRVTLIHNGSESTVESCTPANAASSDSSGSSTGVCPEVCILQVDQMDSFYKRIHPNRAKLVVFCLAIFSVLFFLTFLLISITRASRQHYVFKTKVKFFSLVGPFSKYDFNSHSQIASRLNSLAEIAKVADNVYKQKIKELDRMILVFKKNLGESNGARIIYHLDDLTTSFLSGNVSPEYRRLDQSIIKWSCAIGFMHKYATLHFFKIQKYFALWEKIWAVEYRNYRRSIGLNIDQMSLKSKFSLTLLNDPKLTENKFNSIGLSRLVTWNKVLKEVRLYSTLMEKELHLSVETLPMKLGTRLEHFVYRWDHRIENIVHWSKRMTNIYDWSTFLTQYSKIKEWVQEVSPYLKENSDFRFPVEKLNKGTKVFSSYKIN